MRLLAIALLSLLISLTAQGASIQARLIRATNADIPEDNQLQDIQHQLKKNFGYKHYQQMGNKQAPLKDQDKHHLELGEGFVVDINPKSEQEKTHELEIEWLSGKASIVKTVVKIPEKRTVLIKGPAVGEDWIVLALTVRE